MTAATATVSKNGHPADKEGEESVGRSRTGRCRGRESDRERDSGKEREDRGAPDRRCCLALHQTRASPSAVRAVAGPCRRHSQSRIRVSRIAVIERKRVPVARRAVYESLARLGNARRESPAYGSARATYSDTALRATRFSLRRLGYGSDRDSDFSVETRIRSCGFLFVGPGPLRLASGRNTGAGPRSCGAATVLAQPFRPVRRGAPLPASLQPAPRPPLYTAAHFSTLHRP
jgi:hypothetical protein